MMCDDCKALVVHGLLRGVEYSDPTFGDTAHPRVSWSWLMP